LRSSGLFGLALCAAGFFLVAFLQAGFLAIPLCEGGLACACDGGLLLFKLMFKTLVNRLFPMGTLPR
jgi:hypothetical protein